MLNSKDKVITLAIIWPGPFAASLILMLDKPYVIGTFLWFLIPLIMMMVIELVIWSYPGDAIPRSHWLYCTLYGLRDNPPRYMDFCKIPEDFFIALFSYIFVLIFTIFSYIFGFLVCKKPDFEVESEKTMLRPYKKWPLTIKGVRIKPIWFLLAYGVWWSSDFVITALVRAYDFIGPVNLMTLVAIIAVLSATAYEYRKSDLGNQLRNGATTIVSAIRAKVCLRKPVE